MSKSPPINTNAPGGAEAFKTKNLTGTRSDFKADASLTQASKYSLIWSVPTKPASLKLVLLAMAHFSDADGSSAYPAMATVAGMCSMSVKQARRHVQKLVTLGVLNISRASRGRVGTCYALNLEVLASLNPPANGRVGKKGQPYRAGTSTLPPVTLNPPTNGSQPTLPKLPSNLGEGEVVPTTPPEADVWHSGEIPEYVNTEVWVDVLAVRKDLNPRDILEQAKRHHDAGAIPAAITDGLNKLLINRHWRNLSVETPKVPSIGKRRSVGRARALVIDPGRDTRAPDRDYK